MKNISLTESTGGLGKVTGKNRWRIRLIGVGPGSTGHYTEEALRDTGPLAFPQGTHMHLDHLTESAEWQQPEGSVKDMVGVLASTPEYISEGVDVPGLYAEAEFVDQWAPLIEQIAPYVGLSVAASGYGSDYTDEGKPIIEGFIPHPLNRVDVVTAAGAKGKLIEVLESYKGDVPDGFTIHGNMVENASNGASTRKDSVTMTDEEIQKVAEALSNAISPAIDSLREALTPVEDEGTTEPSDAAEITEALVEADLPKVARARVYKAVEAGTPVKEAIDAEAAYINEVKESVTKDSEAGLGRVKESDSKTDTPSVLTIAGWN